MKNAVTFALDENVWVPLPRRGALPAATRDNWVERATAVAARNSGATGDAVTALRERCASIVDQAGDGEQFVFMPIGEPFPTVVTLTSSEDGPGLRRDVERRVLSDDASASVEARDVDHRRLTGARMAMRVDRASRPVTATVAFWGEADGCGFGLEATTDQLLVAGQIAAAGKALFETFDPRGVSNSR